MIAAEVSPLPSWLQPGSAKTWASRWRHVSLRDRVAPDAAILVHRDADAMDGYAVGPLA